MLKGGFVLILAGLLLAGGAYVWWTKRIPFSLRATATEQSSSGDAENASTTKTATPKSTNSQASTKKTASALVAPTVKTNDKEPAAAGTTAAENTAVNGDAKQQPAVAIRRDPPPPFPTADKIPAGLRGDSVTGTYGDPALSALTSTGRHVVETFVYAKDRGRSATVIRLEDGKVAGAYAQSAPVQASGLSVPPRTLRSEPALKSAPPI